MKRCFALALLFSPFLFAQLSREQKVVDFNGIVALHAKRYAPYEWKKWAFGYDLLDTKPWLARVAASKDDIGFLEICAEYVARLDDLHTSFRFGSSFSADAGIFVDLYDGKPLIESINRVLLPLNQFPFQVGDEIVSVDGAPVEQFMDQMSRLRRMGNPLTTRRNAADWISYRPQAYVPNAVRLGDSVRYEIRRQSGTVEVYDLPWVKRGYPVTALGPVLYSRTETPRAAADPFAPLPGSTARLPEDLDPALRPIWSAWNWSVLPDEPLLAGTTYHEETGEEAPRRYLLGWGARNPTWATPQGFTLRLGRLASEFHYSGVYESGGKRIGYLRFPNFSPASLAQAVNELATEIAYLQQNTDGLVVDVMRNTGGGCYMLNAASYLIPNQFYFFGEQVRPTLSNINLYRATIDVLVAARAPQWQIDLYSGYLTQLESAYRSMRGLTGPIPACSLTFENEPARAADGRVLAYTKPLIVLIDEFSTSAGDIFPAMLQDNRRGPLVGTRTNGAGGSISLWPTGFFSESSTSNTNSLVVRIEPIVTSDYPTAPYVENIGARADIPLAYMTKENLLQRGAPFVRGFTDIILAEIAKGPR